MISALGTIENSLWRWKLSIIAAICCPKLWQNLYSNTPDIRPYLERLVMWFLLYGQTARSSNTSTSKRAAFLSTFVLCWNSWYNSSVTRFHVGCANIRDQNEDDRSRCNSTSFILFRHKLCYVISKKENTTRAECAGKSLLYLCMQIAYFHDHTIQSAF